MERAISIVVFLACVLPLSSVAFAQNRRGASTTEERAITARIAQDVEYHPALGRGPGDHPLKSYEHPAVLCADHANLLARAYNYMATYAGPFYVQVGSAMTLGAHDTTGTANELRPGTRVSQRRDRQERLELARRLAPGLRGKVSEEVKGLSLGWEGSVADGEGMIWRFDSSNAREVLVEWQLNGTPEEAHETMAQRLHTVPIGGRRVSGLGDEAVIYEGGRVTLYFRDGVLTGIVSASSESLARQLAHVLMRESRGLLAR